MNWLARITAGAKLHYRLLLAASLALSATGCKQGILDPQGPIASDERTLLFNSVAIMLTVAVPVIVATLAVAWWYRSTNRHARYRPTWVYSGKIEIVIWSIPAMIILLLGGIAWIGSHDLDPAKPIASARPALRVQVVALDWKWLFIYPQQGVASVNRLVVPAGTPVSLELTSATVMNSFFIPQLGSQIYTMAGMATQLNLLAERAGRYPGLSAQFSGDGFSGMRFSADAVSTSQFAAWVSAARGGGLTLDDAHYAELSKPSEYVAPFTYRAIDPDLFARIAAMTPAAATCMRTEPQGAVQPCDKGL
ncbi:MAG: ubiquinol oxidase subunit II [Rhizomicrobium sp.]